MREEKEQVSNQQGFMLAVKHGIISQLYKDGFLSESVYRKLMQTNNFSVENSGKKV